MRGLGLGNSTPQNRDVGVSCFAFKINTLSPNLMRRKTFLSKTRLYNRNYTVVEKKEFHKHGKDNSSNK